jgi:hypothetical protein
MRNRARLLMLLAPWSIGLRRAAHAQPNVNTPSGGPGMEQGEVQVGAGTQGDVTTGSSGTQPDKAGSGAKKSDAGSKKANDGADKPNAGAARKSAAPGAGPAARKDAKDAAAPGKESAK